MMQGQMKMKRKLNASSLKPKTKQDVHGLAVVKEEDALRALAVVRDAVHLVVRVEREDQEVDSMQNF